MIPQPQGFACVVEPVDRARIDELVEKLKATPTAFGVKSIPGYDVPCLLRVVAAGPGVMYDSGFIRNHIRAGDQLLGTITEMDFAKDSLDPKSHWTFDGKHYIVINTRDYHGIAGSALFIVSREPEVPESLFDSPVLPENFDGHIF